jgi:hypothetical protein
VLAWIDFNVNANKKNSAIFLRQRQNGFFTLDLTPLSGKIRRKAIEGMKVCFMTIEVSSKIKGHTEKSHFFRAI